MLVEHGWAIRIGKAPQDSPYFMLSEDSKGLRIFDTRKKALKHRPNGSRIAVVRVKISEEGGLSREAMSWLRRHGWTRPEKYLVEAGEVMDGDRKAHQSHCLQCQKLYGPVPGPCAQGSRHQDRPAARLKRR